MLTLYVVNKATVPTYTEKIKTDTDAEFGYKSFVYSDIKGLRNSNTFYKKQFPDFYKTLKIIKNRMGKIKDEAENHNAVINQFFKEYSLNSLNQIIGKPDFGDLSKTYNFNENETIIFNSLAETYANLHLIRYFKNDIKIEDFEKTNSQFSETLKNYIKAKKFETPLESEILIALNLTKTQEETTKLDLKTQLNIIKMLLAYSSAITL